MNVLWLLSLAVLANSPLPTQSLNITSVQTVYGAVQPVRKSPDYFPPNDNLCYRFQVAGLHAKDGRVFAEVTTRLLNAKGEMVAFKKLGVPGFPVAGERPVTLIAHLPLNDTLTPGEYTAEVTVTDTVGGADRSFRRPVSLKAPDFAVVSFQFTYDEEGRLGAPTKIQAGQRLCFRMLVAGFDDSQRRMHISEHFEIVEAKTGAVLTRQQAEVKQAVVPTPNATMTCNGQTPVVLQAGNYVMRVTLTDEIAYKTIRYEFPLEITPP